MAVTWTIENKRDSIYGFDPADIIIKHDINGRLHAPDVEDLIASILKKGQLQPAVVRQENGKPVLIAGHSRWTAISLINKRKLTEEPMVLKCVYQRCNESDGLEVTWHENHARKQTTAMDDAHYFLQLEQRGLSVKDIADKLQLTPQFVKEMLALNEVEPEVQAAIATGKVSVTAAKRLKKLSADQQREKVKSNGHGKITAKAIDEEAGKATKPSLRTVRDYVHQHTGPGESAEVAEFCLTLLAFIDGK